jgi:hypothetical protein
VATPDQYRIVQVMVAGGGAEAERRAVEALEVEVNALLRDGWDLGGSLVAAPAPATSRGHCLYQPMIKRGSMG